MQTRVIAREKILPLLENEIGGKLFSAEFIKKDGTIRQGVFRLGVHRYLRGDENKVVRPDNSYVTVFDVRKQGYRTMNLRTLRKLRCNGIEYQVR